MFDTGDDHVITRLDQPEQREVHRIGRVERKSDPVGVSSEAEEFTEHSPGLDDHGLGFYGKLVAGAAGVDAVATEETVHEAVNGFRFRQGRCRIVKVIVVFHRIERVT